MFRHACSDIRIDFQGSREDRTHGLYAGSENIVVTWNVFQRGDAFDRIEEAGEDENDK